jgi:hypothetical protein
MRPCAPLKLSIHPPSGRDCLEKAEGFLIAFVWWLKGAKWDNFALFWPLATRQIEAYSEFPDSLQKGCSQKFIHQASSETQKPSWIKKSPGYSIMPNGSNSES